MKSISEPHNKSNEQQHDDMSKFNILTYPDIFLIQPTQPLDNIDGKVQEMIDICDFAVGQSRQLYGFTMQSERPKHRMYDQYHPLGIVGIVSAFNFPVAVWSWNALIAAVCGDTCVWKPSPKTPLTAIAVQKICNEALRDQDFPPIFSLFIDDGVDLAERFVDDTRVDLVSFTGSCAVGRKVGHRVAARMGRR